MPSGKRFLSSSILAYTLAAVSIELAPGSPNTVSATVGSPSRVAVWSYCWAPSCTPPIVALRPLPSETSRWVETTSRNRTTAADWPTAVAAVPAAGGAAGSAVARPVPRVAPKAAASAPAGPPWPTLTMMSPNSSVSTSRPRVLIVSWNCCPRGTGCWPICPAATWTFCWPIAATTSDAVRPSDANFSGSSQARIE